MPPRKKKSEPNLLKKRRAKLDKMIVRVHNASVELDELWNAAMESQLGSFKITSDGKISGPSWDAVASKIWDMLGQLREVRGPDPKRVREHLEKVYQEKLLAQRVTLVTGVDERIKHYMDQFQNHKFIECIYLSCYSVWRQSCEPKTVFIQKRWRRLLVLPWRRRRDIVQCLGDEPSDVVNALISNPLLTDHVYVNGELDERRLVDLAGIIRQSGAAMARSKVLRRICASCGRCHAVVREKAFPVCSCGGPHYCSVACQTAHWEAHHARQCGKDKESREGYRRHITPRFCFNLPDGDVLDLYEIGKRNLQRDADAADAAVAAAVAAAAMRALSPGVVSY